MAQDTTAVVVRLQADYQRLQRDLARSQRDLRKYQNQSSGILKNIGSQFAAAFAVSSIASFGLEVVKLAGKAENVKLAFDKLGDSAKLLERMKAATSGTVSELELMQQAVKANNFKISLEALPRLLEFATLRARQTGESVDYLVNSIVTGIGRKSLLILDNLGISATALKEELGGVSPAAVEIGQVAEAVGRIAERELALMGTASENAGLKIERLSANWENLKENIGKVGNESNILTGILDDLNKVLEGKSEERSVIARLIFTGPEVKKSLELAAQGVSSLYGKVKEFGGAVFTFPLIVDFFKDLLQIDGKKIGDSLIGPLPQQLGFFEQALKDVEAAGKKAQTTFSKPLINPGAISGLDGGSLVSFTIPAPKIDKEGFQRLQYEYSEWMIRTYNAIQRVNEDFRSIVTGTLTDAISAAVESIASGKGLKGAFNSILSVIAEGLISLGRSLIAYGISMKLARKALENPLTSFGAALAGGAAAIAAGTILKGAIASKSSGISAGLGGSSGGGPSFQNQVAGQTINLGGEFTIRGNDLVLALDRNTALKKRTN